MLGSGRGGENDGSGCDHEQVDVLACGGGENNDHRCDDEEGEPGPQEA